MNKERSCCDSRTGISALQTSTRCSDACERDVCTGPSLVAGRKEYIVVIAFMIGGTALCVTSLVLAWKVLGRKLKRIGEPANDLLAAR